MFYLNQIIFGTSNAKLSKAIETVNTVASKQNEAR